jgi:type IV secretion system protein VirB6
MGFFTNFWNFLQLNVLNTVSIVTSDISTSLTPAVVTFATIYIMLWGYLHLRGAIEEPIMEGAKRILVLAVILGVVLSLWEYNAVFIDFFITTPNALSGAVLNGNNAIATIDGIWVKGATVAESLINQGGVLNNHFAFYIAGFAVYLFVGFICVWMAYLFCLSIVAVGILLALGPLFILGLMFETTKRFFEAWVAQLSNYALIIVIAAVAAKILLTTLEDYANSAINSGAGITIAQSIQLCLACAFVLIIMKQVPSLAAGLASGVALSTYNAMSSLMKGVASGTGKSMYQFGRGMADGRAGEKPSRHMSLTRNLGNRLTNRQSSGGDSTGGKIARKNVF